MSRRESRGPRSSHNSGPRHDPREAPRAPRPSSTRHQPQPPPRQTQWLPLWEQGLDDFDDPRKTPPDHALYREVKAVARYALQILGLPRSREVLTDIGKDAVKAWDRHEHVYFDKPDRMSDWVDTFLHRLEQNFVRVELAKRMPYNGAFKPKDWNLEGDRAKKWEPQLAGEIYLNYFVRPPVLSGPSRDRYISKLTNSAPRSLKDG